MLKSLRSGARTLRLISARRQPELLIDALLFDRNSLNNLMPFRASYFDAAQDFFSVGLMLAFPFNNRKPENSPRSRIDTQLPMPAQWSHQNRATGQSVVRLTVSAVEPSGAAYGLRRVRMTIKSASRSSASRAMTSAGSPMATTLSQSSAGALT